MTEILKNGALTGALPGETIRFARAQDRRAVASWYDRNAVGFSRRSQAMDVSYPRGRFLAHLEQGARILDVGCGAGRDIGAFLSMGYDAHGIDISAGMVSQSRTIADASRIRLLAIEDLDPRTERWDGIWCMAGMVHHPEAALPGLAAHLMACLRPGGVFYLSFKDFSGEVIDGLGRPMSGVAMEAVGSFLDRMELARTGIAHMESFRTVNADSLSVATAWTNLLLVKR